MNVCPPLASGSPDPWSALIDATFTHASPQTETITTDLLVIGAGIAGLSFALSLAFPARVMLVTKGALGESNTRYAQGGLAAAVAETDSAQLHLDDTIAAGAGLVDVDAAGTMVFAGRKAVEWLVEHGTAFDRDGSAFALGREGAHSQSRVLHAGGDATGAEIERALVARIDERHDLTLLEHATAMKLHRHDGRCVGADLVVGAGRPVKVTSAITVLAMGGAGQLWAVTSNPDGATGDGITLALHAGAILADLEFAQFHPTVLDVPGEEPFLISEAVRGMGAWLRNDSGERFMLAADDRAELASRDVIARAIQLQHAADSRVWLDLRHLDPVEVHHRFPTITRHLHMIGLDLARDLIPVAPAAHYFMGGVAASVTGHTSVPGLLAIGEVSCTGVHGANRLASNSLLEGLVCGQLAARAVHHTDLEMVKPSFGGATPPLDVSPVRSPDTISALRRRLQHTMRDHVSVVRTASSLNEAITELDQIIHEPVVRDDPSLGARQLINMATLAREVAISARMREESRGGHYRQDFPHRDHGLDGHHLLVSPTLDGTTHRIFGRVADAWRSTVRA